MGRMLAHEERNCRVEVTLSSLGAGDFELSYGFLNKNVSGNAYLFNLLHDGMVEEAKYRLKIGGFYLELDGEGAVVSKKLVRVPDHLAVERPNIPCVSKVAPGELFAETIHLSLPLIPRTPYFSYVRDGADCRPQWLKLFFEMGFFLAHPDGEGFAKTVETSEGPTIYFSPFSPASQSIIRVGPFDDLIRVMVPSNT
jgi:hypothetical protein